MADDSSPRDKTHQQALDRFKLVVETEHDQRVREQEDLKFDAGDQWPEDVVKLRQGVQSQGQGQPAIPARPMITIRSLDQPIAQIVNQARNARFAIKVSPKSGAEQKDADVRQGLIRAIENDSHAQTAYLWAYQRAVICGRGYFRINKAWAFDDPDDVSEAPAKWDQDLRIEPILNGGSVYLDPWAQAMNDPGACEWAFVTEDVPETTYKRRFGESKLATATNDETLTSLGDYKNQWILSDEAGKQSYRIAEYWWVKYDEKTEKNPANPSQERTIQTRTVMWAKMNGVEFLEPPQEWDGRFIPIIPVIGNEKNLGGKRLFEGLVRPNLGPCRMVNYLVSSDAENMGLATKAPWIGYEGQFEGHEAQWAQANTRNQPYLEVKAVTDETGAQVLPPPMRNVPTYPPSTEAIGLYVNFIRSTTGVPDAALGHTNPNDRSGKAIAALQQASEQGTSNFPDNLTRAIRHAGVVLLDLLPKIYDREGRIAQILEGDDDSQRSVVLNQPFAQPPGGPPVPMQPGQAPPPQPGPAGGPPMAAPVEHYDLSKGQFNVIVEVGKSFATKQQEERDGMLTLAQVAPEMLPRYADLLVKAIGGPMADAIAERVKPPGMDSGLPPEVQSAVMGLQQENQQLKQILETKRLEQEASLQKAQMDNAARVEVARIGAQTQLVVAEIKDKSADQDRRIALLEAMIGFEKEARLESGRRDHEHATQAHAQSHEVGMAVLAHQHAKDQAEQQAALQPEPEAEPAETGA